MRRLLGSAAVGRLATVGADGAPHLVPVCFVLVRETIYTAVDRKPKTTTSLRRLDNLRGDPRVSLLVDHYENDWTKLWWVRMDGRAEVLEEGAERNRAIDHLRAKYDQYRANPPDGPAIAIAVERWRGWAATEPAELSPPTPPA